MSLWWQRMRTMLGLSAPVMPHELDEPEEEARPIDEKMLRREGRPVVCVIGTSGLAAIDREAFVIEPIGEGLSKIVGFEHDYDVLFADRGSLERRGFRCPEVWEIAHANTRRIMPIIPTAPELLADPDFCFESDRLVPSMFAELEAWERIAAEVGDTLYAAPVSDCFALVGLAGDGDALDDIRTGARADYETTAGWNDMRNRAISPEVYRFRDGGWRKA